MAVLAIDQGTTSTGALRLEDDGTVRIVATVDHRQHYPAAGHVEHDPEQLVASLRTCIEVAGGVDAIGIDNQGESCLAWDAETGEALTPVIVWQDSRTQPAVDRLKADGAEDMVLARSGLPLDSYFSASKLAWIVENVPAAKERLSAGKLRLGTTDAFFLERLTGVCATDITTASRTSLMNLETGEWDAELCALFGVPIEALPPIRPTTGDFGAVESGGARIPVTASVVDQQAALYGHGCRNAGDAKITFGTGAFALVVTGETLYRAPEQGLLPTVAWQLVDAAPVYALDGGIYCASAAVNWAKGLGLFEHFGEIGAFERPPAIERRLAFVPALAGLACPHWDRNAVGLWIGLTLDTDRRDMMQALLEGVAFRAAEVLEAMAGHVALGDTISVDGGMSVNPYFCQVLADVLDKTVVVPGMAELTALGTAQLAMGRDVPSKTAGGKTYQPERDMRGARDLFAEAVVRARNWGN